MEGEVSNRPNAPARAWLGVLLALLAVLSPAVLGRTVNIRWKANAETNVVGYRVHYGFLPTNYVVTLDVGPQTNAVIELRFPGEVYRFAVTAYNDFGLESPYSAEVTTTNDFSGGTLSTNRIALDGVEDTPLPISWTQLGLPDGTGWLPIRKPAHGGLQADPGGIAYMPDPNANGEDSFELFAFGTSNHFSRVTVDARVQAVDDPPVALDSRENVPMNRPSEITLYAADPDLEDVMLPAGLRYELREVPVYGDVELAGNRVTYTPDPGFEGIDSLTFVVRDGQSESEPGRVLLLTEPQDFYWNPVKPPAWTVSLSVPAGLTSLITLPGNEPGGFQYMYYNPEGPQHGARSGVEPEVFYTPAPGYQGPDTVKYQLYDLSDVFGYLGVGEVRITVRPPSPTDATFATIHGSDRRLVLSWPAEPGRSYRVQTTSRLEPGVWEDALPLGRLPTVSPDGTRVFWTVFPKPRAVGGTVFFRLVPAE